MCCGTKRGVEIRCPSDCQYLSTARAHPAAVVKRQQEHDFKVFMPTVRDLSERQAELLWQILSFVRDYRGDVLLKTTDADVEAAAAALAATHETAARGLIYEQRPNSLPAQRLASDIAAFIAQAGEERPTSLDRDLAAVFHAIERGAHEAGKTLAGGDTAYLSLLRRVLLPGPPQQSAPTAAARAPEQPPSLLIRP